jgi:predicted RNase H-like HicB family nuclease
MLAHAMKKIAIHLEREADGRWIAEADGFPGVLTYGPTRDEAFQAAAACCLRVILDRMEHGETPSIAIVDELFAVA